MLQNVVMHLAIDHRWKFDFLAFATPKFFLRPLRSKTWIGVGVGPIRNTNKPKKIYPKTNKKSLYAGLLTYLIKILNLAYIRFLF